MKSKAKALRQARRTALRRRIVGASLAIGAAVPLLAAEEDEAAQGLFEGGPVAYANWVEVSAGAFLPSGSRAQAEERHGLDNGFLGGIEDLHYQATVATNLTLTVDGRAIFDNNDYRLILDLQKPELGYLRFRYEEFRTYYNGNGGYYRPADVFYPLPDDALELDRGELSIEAGLLLKDIPQFVFKYSHLFRDGEKGSTSWGSTHPTGTTLTRGLSPTIYGIDEDRDIFALDVSHRIKQTDVGLGLRYETGDLGQKRKISQWPGEAAIERKITDRQENDYDSFSAHAFSETWLRQNLFFSSGFSFVNLDSDLSGDRIYGSDFDVSYAPNVLNGLGYTDLTGEAEKQEYALDLNLMSLPRKDVSLTGSMRVQWEDWDANSAGMQTLGVNAPVLMTSDSDGDAFDIRERLEAKYTGVTNWVLYARGDWTQGQGDLREDGGIGTTAPVQRRTDTDRLFQKYAVGARWYVARGFNMDIGGYYKRHDYDYEHSLDSTPNDSGNRYPAYLRFQDFDTYDGNIRLTLRPWQKVSLISRYEYQLSTIHTQPDAVSGLAEVESSEMTSHIIGQNVSWVPWSRLSLQAGVNYVISETETPASQVTQAILDSQNNYWTVNCNAGFAIDDKTDLNVGYFYYCADNYRDNSASGLPLGASGEEHGITARLTRQITKQLRWSARYGYFTYNDQTSGGNNDYDAHVIYSSLQYQF